jgi:hypothetical protein
LGIQRNPYWPLNGPSFFPYRDSESRCSHCTKADAGIGRKLSGTDGTPTNKGFEETRHKLRRPTIPCESITLVAYQIGFWTLFARRPMVCSKFPMDYNSPVNRRTFRLNATLFRVQRRALSGYLVQVEIRRNRGVVVDITRCSRQAVEIREDESADTVHRGIRPASRRVQ